MNFLDLIKSDGYITVSKELAREIGLQETIILSELISQYDYFRKRNELDQEGYFYCTIEKLEKNTTIAKKTQTRKINKLVDLGLIEKDLKGLPAKRHFKINEKEILKLFFDENPDNPRHVQKRQNVPSKGVKKHQQEGSNRPNINNNNNNNKTEEEDARIKKKIPEKIKTKFEQVFNRKLSVELYNKLIKIYSDPQILMKALQVAEEKADKPNYLLVILKDWKEKNMTSVNEIDTYLKNRQSKKNNHRSPAKNNKEHKDLYDIDNLKAKGWN